MSLSERARFWTLALVEQPSVTNSAGERDFGPWLAQTLLERPCFAAHPQQVRALRTEDDLFERSSVFALVRGSGRETVVLTGHYDVVSVDNYGALAAHAFSPETLRETLLAELPHCASAADRLALRDLESGDFLPGRAMLDMKSGLGAGLALLEHFAENPARTGNLLFLAVPDEEEASHGMRSAARQLERLAQEWDLELLGAISLDAEVDPHEGDAGQAIFLGSVGKVLPTVMLIGRPTHAGAPFDGVSSALMLSELLRRIECDPDWLQNAAEDRDLLQEPETPPVLLQLDDLKDHYDVTTPEMLWCSFNVLLRRATPKSVLEGFVTTVQAALETTLAMTRERMQRYALLHGGTVPDAPIENAQVLTYAELLEEVRAVGGNAALLRLEALSNALSQDPRLDLPGICQRLTCAAVREAGLVGPAAVVGMGSWYYPTARLEAGQPERGEGTARLRAALEHGVRQTEREEGVRVRLREFFPGVSDMSFLGAQPSGEDVRAVCQNTPAWGGRLSFDYGALRALPTVNIGPWGRDYHQRTERLFTPYAFGTLPRLLERVCAAWLSAVPEREKVSEATTSDHARLTNSW